MSKETMLPVYASIFLMTTVVCILFPAAHIAEQKQKNTITSQKQFNIIPRNCYLTNN